MPAPEPLTPFDAFLAVLQTSHLLPDGHAEELKLFQASMSPRGTSGETAPAFCDYLISRGLLTRWQCDRLLEGRHIGFYVDGYKVLTFVRVEENHTVYLAEDPVTKHRVHALSTPPPCSPDGKGRIRLVEIGE